MAKAELGIKYIEGDGVTTNATEGVHWLREGIRSMELAANTTKTPAESFLLKLTAAEYSNRLGSYYDTGNFLPKDRQNAVSWFRHAAELGDTKAQVRLGYMLSREAKNATEAAKWFRMAADQGNADAQASLGSCYYDGTGVAKDYAEAVKWLRKAADQGNAGAQTVLGECYYDGQGVTQDYAEAVKWYRKAAEQNFAGAQYILGACYRDGEGVAKNYVEGYRWVLLAAAQGEKIAKRAAHELEDVMTREQIAEGQKLAREFKPRKLSESDSDNSRFPPRSKTR
jgi:uncharacterized protein